MMPLSPYGDTGLVLISLTRAGIGIGFIGVALELAVIIWKLGTSLLFRRTLTIFAVFIGVCGVARMAEAWLVFAMVEHMPPDTWLMLILDGLSAVCALAATIVLFPLAWNAAGGHMSLDKM